MGETVQEGGHIASKEKTREEGPGLVCAFHIDNEGKARQLDFDEVKTIRKKPEGEGWYWVHMDVDDAPTKEWLGNYKGMLNSVASALGTLRSRPRSYVFDLGILLILRGINLNPGADREDMLSLRIWMNDKIVITTRREKLMAVDVIRKDFEAGKGPQNTQDLLCRLINGLIDRITDVVEEMDDKMSLLEDTYEEHDNRVLQKEIQKLRAEAITLLRFITPQRPALTELLEAGSKYLDAEHSGELRILLARISSNIEELTAIRDRAISLHDAVTSEINDQMNRAMYLLSIITAIFLPLTLFSGLLGINVGGIPGEGWVPAFWIVCAIMVVMGAITWYVMKRFDLI